MTEVELTFREAIPEDAPALLSFMKQVEQETEFLAFDEAGLAMEPELLGLNLAAIYESENNLLLVALAGEQIVATASVKAAAQFRLAHVGEVGISVLQAYWGFGIGSWLLGELLEWAKSGGVIRRLELTVQARNERAIHLYEKFGFVTEAVMPRGARSDAGEFLDVNLMSKLIG